MFRFAVRNFSSRRPIPPPIMERPGHGRWTEMIEKEHSGGHLDPVTEPAKLHAVWLVKTLRRQPWRVKQICIDEFNLKKISDVAIVRNSPEQNSLLAQVKHILRIQPLTTPRGLPSDPAEFKYCQLRENGELVYVPRITDEREPAVEAQAMSNAELFHYNKLRVSRHELAIENFPSEYTYKRNEDGKEYRYADLHAQWNKKNANVTS